LPELLHGGHSEWAELYDPKRRLHAYGALVAEVAHSTTPYLDWLRGGDVRSFDDIGRGSGALVRHGLHVLAAYRDDAGEVHACSATCPHLRGIVQWNAAEKTWDCPCHGSRFDRYGKVVNGPAISDLADPGAEKDA
jgi:Rieske Fe-S protein